MKLPRIRFSRPLAMPIAVLTLASTAMAQPQGQGRRFTSDLGADQCTFTDEGRNRFFVLEAGHQTRLAGEIGKHDVEVTATVLDQTRLVDGVLTRAIEEVDVVDGSVVEISRSYHAICRETQDAYVFGRELLVGPGDPDEEGGTEAWQSGVEGARPGMTMPGRFMLGARYYLELAPGVALDRAENVAMDVAIDTPAGHFDGCVMTTETSPLEPGEQATLIHAEGIGIVADGGLRLVGWTP